MNIRKLRWQFGRRSVICISRRVYTRREIEESRALLTFLPCRILPWACMHAPTVEPSNGSTGNVERAGLVGLGLGNDSNGDEARVTDVVPGYAAFVGFVLGQVQKGNERPSAPYGNKQQTRLPG